MRRIVGTLLATSALGCALLLPAAPAGAAIDIYAGDPAALVGSVEKVDCRVKRGGKFFHAEGKTTNGRYTLSVDIYAFKGFGPDYQVPFGVINPTVNVEGVGTPEDYSNNYPFPGTPPPSSGAIAFGKKGKKMGIGIYTLPNSDYSAGLVLAGPATCKYPAKKKKKK